MTQTAPRIAEQPTTTPSPVEIAAVADSFTSLMRSFIKARTQMLAAAAHDVEWSAHIVLKCLSNEGPLRSSALAELINSDPSTVSRQVAGLVKDGLVERQADPADGRANLLMVTADAQQLIQRHDQIRDSHFSRMLATWTDDDLHRFAQLLGRFRDDFDAIKNDWLPERVDGRPSPAEGND
jgi:DNA-binding MarR family transcriptional regulator